MRTTILLLAALLTVASLAAPGGDAAATTFLDTDFGTPRGNVTARGAALGETGISTFSDVGALVLNPALLATAPAGWQLHFSVGLTQVNEDRFIPLYDEFDSFINETAFALNRNSYAFGQGGVVYRVPTEMPMSLAVGVFDRYDLDYDYREELRGPTDDTLLGSRSLDVDGRLRSFSVGYGAEVYQGYSVGLSAHRYFGTIEANALEVTGSSTVTGDTELDRTEVDPSGWGWSVGVRGRPDDRVELGFAFDGPFTLDGDAIASTVTTSPGNLDAVTESRFTREDRYPAALRFGATYHPRNVLRTQFSIEAVRRFWENLERRTVAAGETTEVDGVAMGLRDTWDVRLGLEHVFYSGMPARFGFRYLQNYADRESARAIFSAGIGYPVAGFTLDVTGQYHRQTSRQMFIFDPAPAGGDVPATRPKVEDSVIRLIVGVTRPF